MRALGIPGLAAAVLTMASMAGASDDGGPSATPASPPPANPSCDGGPGAGTDCQGRSCCERLEVPGGSFLYRPSPRSDGQPRTVRPFALDRYEATVGRFAAWLKAGAPVPTEGAVLQTDLDGKPIRWTRHATFAAQRTDARLRGWVKYDTWSARMHRAPKNSVNWYTAAAFCRWNGGRLPTDVEWHYVAVGGDEQRRFPWGSEAPTLSHAVYNCGGDGRSSCDLKDLLPVGSKPRGAGRWGHDDLAGSVFEWTVMTKHRANRGKSEGGGFCYIGGVDHRAPEGLKAGTARLEALETVSHTVGVRCAYDLPASDHP